MWRGDKIQILFYNKINEINPFPQEYSCVGCKTSTIALKSDVHGLLHSEEIMKKKESEENCKELFKITNDLLFKSNAILLLTFYDIEEVTDKYVNYSFGQNSKDVE